MCDGFACIGHCLCRGYARSRGGCDCRRRYCVRLTLSYALPVETVDIAIGHIEYLFPNGGRGTSEVFVSACKSPLKNFSMGIDAYYDYGEVDDYYLAATLAYNVPLDSSLEIGASATAGYAGEDFSPGPERPS